MKKKLSVCIAFRNEGEQVTKTISSLINAFDKSQYELEIIVINDYSDDDYDYSTIPYYEGVEYYINETRLGSSLTKQKAIQLATSDYIFVIDAHMRFKANGFETRIFNEIDNDDQCIYALYTVGFNPHNNDKWNQLEHRCSYLQLGGKLLFGATWSNFDLDQDNVSMCRVPVVMGASYFFSRAYFNKLKGFEGLRLYGREEEYLSIKSWGIGHGCYLIKDIQVAHLYRKVAPQPITRKEVWHNILVIGETLLSSYLCSKIADKMIKRDSITFNRIYNELDHDKCIELREYYKELGYSYKKFEVINTEVFEHNKSK